MSHIRHHGVLLWNGVAGDWLSMDMWLGTCCAPGERMRARGLLYPLLVARTTRFGIPAVCSRKGEWVEHGVQCHEIHGGIIMWVGLKGG